MKDGVFTLRIAKIRPLHEACGLCCDAQFPLHYLDLDLNEDVCHPCKDALKLADLMLQRTPGMSQPILGTLHEK